MCQVVWDVFPTLVYVAPSTALGSQVLNKYLVYKETWFVDIVKRIVIVLSRLVFLGDLFIYCVELGVEPRALYVRGKHSATELSDQP